MSSTCSVANWPFFCCRGSCEYGPPLLRTNRSSGAACATMKPPFCVVAAVVEGQHVGVAAQHQQPRAQAERRDAVADLLAFGGVAAPAVVVAVAGDPRHRIHPHQQRHVVGGRALELGEQPGLLRVRRAARRPAAGVPSARRSSGTARGRCRRSGRWARRPSARAAADSAERRCCSRSARHRGSASASRSRRGRSRGRPTCRRSACGGRAAPGAPARARGRARAGTARAADRAAAPAR